MSILTVTPNAAIDRTLVVPHLAINGVFRETEKWIAAGGKGINVARAIHQVGGEAICAGFIGGWNGQYLRHLLSDENIGSHWTEITGETRNCTIIIDSSTGSNTVVNERGTAVNQEDWLRLRSDVLHAVHDCKIVCFSGSLPPESPIQSYASLLSELMEQEKSVWIDTSGEPLRAVNRLAGVQIKVNRHEFGDLLGISIADIDDLRQAAEIILQQPWKAAVITMGSQGAAYITQNEQWVVTLPPVKAFCAVGSGDSFLAGLVHGEELGLPASDCLRMGAAAGAANTLIIGGGRFIRQDYERILAETIITPL
jgi:1-phosphofructokinase family hexose kinase